MAIAVNDSNFEEVVLKSPDFVNVSPKNHLQIMGRYVDVVS